jgi:hypothetical protein
MSNEPLAGSDQFDVPLSFRAMIDENKRPELNQHVKPAINTRPNTLRRTETLAAKQTPKNQQGPEATERSLLGDEDCPGSGPQ